MARIPAPNPPLPRTCYPPPKLAFRKTLWVCAGDIWNPVQKPPFDRYTKTFRVAKSSTQPPAPYHSDNKQSGCNPLSGTFVCVTSVMLKSNKTVERRPPAGTSSIVSTENTGQWNPVGAAPTLCIPPGLVIVRRLGHTAATLHPSWMSSPEMIGVIHASSHYPPPKRRMIVSADCARESMIRPTP